MSLNPNGQQSPKFNPIEDYLNSYLIMGVGPPLFPYIGDAKRGWFATRRLLDYKNRCVFCGKMRQDVKNLVGLPAKINSCNECIELMVEIIEEEDFKKWFVNPFREIIKQQEIEAKGK